MSCGAPQSVAGSGSGHKRGRERVVLRVRPALHTRGGRTCSGGTCLQTLEDRVVASNASGRPPTAHMSGEPGQAPNDAAARVRADLGLMSSNSQRARRTRHSRPTSAERRSQ